MNNLLLIMGALVGIDNDVSKENSKNENICKVCRSPRQPYSRDTGNFDLRAVEDVALKNAKRNAPRCGACRFLCETAHKVDEGTALETFEVSVTEDSQDDGVQIHLRFDTGDAEYYRMFGSPSSRRGQIFKAHIHRHLESN